MDFEKQQTYNRSEIQSIDDRLKDWFINRRFAMERNMSIRKVLESNNFIGLNHSSSDCKSFDEILWNDLINGRPKIEESLSADAQTRKADLYLNIFNRATDAEHPCITSGSIFLNCLRDHGSNAESKCDALFKDFDKCRQDLKTSQNDKLSKLLVSQQTADDNAKALFQRRQIFLKSLNRK